MFERLFTQTYGDYDSSLETYDSGESNHCADSDGFRGSADKDKDKDVYLLASLGVGPLVIMVNLVVLVNLMI